MPQIKQQKKRVLTNEKARARNKARKIELKHSIKNVLRAVDAKNKEEAVAAYAVAASKIDKAVSKGLKHKNYAKNQKSRLAKLVNTI